MSEGREISLKFAFLQLASLSDLKREQAYSSRREISARLNWSRVSWLARRAPLAIPRETERDNSEPLDRVGLAWWYVITE